MYFSVLCNVNEGFLRALSVVFGIYMFRFFRLDIRVMSRLDRYIYMFCIVISYFKKFRVGGYYFLR